MKKLLGKNKFIILFIGFLLLAALIERSDWAFENIEPDVNAFTNILLDKEFKADALMDSIFLNAEKGKLSNWVNENSTSIDYLYREHGLVFLVFLKNQMVYWTSNSIALPDNLYKNDESFAKLGNTYAEIRKKQNDTICIVGLISIMDEFPFENKFLKNGFHSSFNLDCPHNLSINKNLKSAIYNNKNEYLFTLIKEGVCKTELKRRLLVLFILLAFAALLLFGRQKFKNVSFSPIQFIYFAFAAIVARVLLQIFNKTLLFSSLQIFQAKYFAFSDWFPSLGDLLITVILVMYLIFVFYSKVWIKGMAGESKQKLYFTLGIWITLILVYATLANQIFTHLIVDSSFQYEAYDVLNLSIFSFIGYFIILMLFVGLILLIDKACLQMKGAISLRKLFSLVTILGLLLILLAFLSQKNSLILPLAFLFLVLLYWAHARLVHTPNFGRIVILVAIFSLFATYFIRKENFSKRIEESKVLAVSLAREQDPVAEVIITEVIANIKADTNIVAFLENEWFDYNKMTDYINRTYFTGYLGRYNFQLTVCNEKDSVLLDENEQYWTYCYGFFNDLLRQNGVETNIPGLYYLNDITGGLNYFIKIPLNLSSGWRDVTLFFELFSRPNIEVLGYPELLLEKSIDLYDSYKTASYAKYAKNRLVVRSGDFPYALERDVYGYSENEFVFFQSEEFDHLLYNSNEDHAVLVSFPTVLFYNIIISFTYIFFFLLIQTVFLLILGNHFTHLIDFHFGIKNKIVFSMMLILLISLLFVGGGTIMYTYNRFEQNQIDMLSEKVQSVLVELEHKIANHDNIHDVSQEYINNLLVKFSNVFYSDINLYDANGSLAGTSRKEIFDRKLTGNQINATAFRELVLNKKARIVHKEFIGKMEYYSAYVPFVNSENKLLAYINLPYFSKEVLLRKELLRVIVAVINIYAFLLVLSIIIAVYISNLVTEPLRMVQQRIRNIDLSKNNERIDYQGDDEIGELVIEYNRMLGELDKSAKLLARSERESAWREMARQIAHEINNPLTPMKLSIQLLNKSWKNKDVDFGDRFQRSTHTLIEQIDSLSSIATAFSQFARMPIARSEKVNIIERINRSVELFKDLSSVSLTMNLSQNEEVFVRADNERMLQVFNNLFKNAIQAIPLGVLGEVVINLSQTNDSVVVEIKDNGTGVQPEMESKLFQPNFTTKSSGTGLGLAIVKNIIEEFDGAIWYQSELGKGSSFFISMPKYTIEEGE